MEKSLVTKEYRLFLSFLKEARQNSALTQIDLAKKLKVTQSFVSKCERGERRIDVIELRRWSRALGFSLVDFVGVFEAYLKKHKTTSDRQSNSD
jgi:transcriptional regulator with XRE-family HTH domain